MAFIKKFNAVFDGILNACLFFACVIVAWQTVSVTGNTILRYVFNRPITGVDNITEYGILWLTFLSIAWLLKKNRHIKVDLVTNALSVRTQLYLDTIFSAVAVGLSVILVIAGIQVVQDMWATHYIDPFKIEGVPEAIPIAIVPFGFLLLSIQFIRRFVENVVTLRKPVIKATDYQPITGEGSVV